MLSVKQGGIKYHFLSLWYDSTRYEPESPGPLANTLTITPMSGQKKKILDNRLYYKRKIELHRKGKKFRNVLITPILICGIWCSRHPTGMFGTRPFFGGSDCRAGAHTHLAFPKMSMARSAFPFLRRRAITPPQGLKAWEKAPLRSKEISRSRDTLSQIRASNNTAGRSATQHLERCRQILICDICCSPHLTGKCGTKLF